MDRVRAGIGCVVLVRWQDHAEEQRYQIVAHEEADAARRRISSKSALAQALANHGVGDRVAVSAAGGKHLVTILEIRRFATPMETNQ
jgi:transcription elongation GreA/GreB family factor